jgi:hypothetical protein
MAPPARVCSGAANKTAASANPPDRMTRPARRRLGGSAFALPGRIVKAAPRQAGGGAAADCGAAGSALPPGRTGTGQAPLRRQRCAKSESCPPASNLSFMKTSMLESADFSRGGMRGRPQVTVAFRADAEWQSLPLVPPTLPTVKDPRGNDDRLAVGVELDPDGRDLCPCPIRQADRDRIVPGRDRAPASGQQNAPVARNASSAISCACSQPRLPTSKLRRAPYGLVPRTSRRVIPP